MKTDKVHEAIQHLKLLDDHDFQREVAQVRARAALAVLPGEPPEVSWNYHLPRLLRNATAALIDVELAIDRVEDPGIHLPITARRVGQIWESISRLSDGRAKTIAQVNSILAYELAGYQANSVCIARDLIANYPDTDELMVLIARFFRRQFFQAIRSSSEVLDFSPDESDGANVDTAALLEMASRGLVAGAITEASSYFLRGNEDNLDHALTMLGAASAAFESIGAVNHHSLARLLRQTLPRMKQRSTWHLLGSVHSRNDVWHRYLVLLARGLGERIDENSGIVELWPSQITALKQGLFDPTASIMVRMPTSAGKTRIAEMAMVHQLVTNPDQRCIYIAPFNALGGEIEGSYSGLFSDLGFRLSTTLGGFETNVAEQEFLNSADVVISTPEKLDFMLRVNRSFFDSVGLIVIDEGQLIEDAARGAHFELLLSRIRVGWPSIRFVSLSAVIPESTLEDIAAWLGSENSSVSASDWRPAVQRHAMFVWRGNKGQINSLPDPDIPGIEGFLPNVIEIQAFPFTNPETLRVNNPKFPDKLIKAQTAAELAYTLAPTGAVLVFCPTRRIAESVSSALLERLRLTRQSGRQVHQAFDERARRSSQVCTDWLGDDHELTVKLKNGIAVHHGGVPDAVKKAIERDFRKRELQVIVATSTLAQGVNLPIKTVIIHSTFRHIDGTSVPIMAREYWNIAGRAGRAGEETEGLILHLCQDQRDVNRARSYAARKTDLEPLKSALLEDLSRLAEERITDPTYLQYLDADLLAMLVEEDVEEVTDEWVDSRFSSTLAVRQARRYNKDVSALNASLGKIFKGVLSRVPEKDRRVAFATTGLSVESCQLMLEHIQRHADELSALLPSATSADLERLIDLFLEGCFLAEEIRPQSEPFFNVRELTKMWISGQDYSSMRSSFTDLTNGAESISTFIEDTFGYRLPWGIAAYLRLVVHELNIQEATFSTMVRYFSSMVKHGVPSPYAVWAITAGISYRSVAFRIGEAYATTYPASDVREFTEWLSGWTVDGLRQEFGLVGSVLEEVVQALQKAAPSPLIRQSALLPLTAGVLIEDQLAQVASQGLRPGDIVQLGRDYSVVYNRNAVACYFDQEYLGMLNNEVAQLLAPMMDSGNRYEGTVQSLVSESLGKRLEITVSSAPDLP